MRWRLRYVVDIVLPYVVDARTLLPPQHYRYALQLAPQFPDIGNLTLESLRSKIELCQGFRYAPLLAGLPLPLTGTIGVLFENSM